MAQRWPNAQLSSCALLPWVTTSVTLMSPAFSGRSDSSGRTRTKASKPLRVSRSALDPDAALVSPPYSPLPAQSWPCPLFLPCSWKVCNVSAPGAALVAGATLWNTARSGWPAAGHQWPQPSGLRASKWIRSGAKHSCNAQIRKWHTNQAQTTNSYAIKSSIARMDSLKII